MRNCFRLALAFMFVTPLWSTGLANAKDAPTPKAIFDAHLVNHRLFLKARGPDNRPLKLLLDTGATATVLFDEDTPPEISEPGISMVNFPALHITTPGRIIEGFNLSIEDIDLGVIKALSVHDALAHEIEPAIGFDGVLGRDIMDKYIIDIDSKKKLVKLWEKGSDLSHFFPMIAPLHSDANRPVVDLRLSLPWDKKARTKNLMLDSGFAGTLVLWQNKRFLTAVRSTFETPLFLRANYAVVMDFSFAGVKLQKTPAYMVIRHQIPMDETEIEKSDGLIGMAFMSLFHYAIDMEGKKLYLKAYKKRRPSEQVTKDMLKYAPNDRQVYVLNVTPNVANCMIKVCIRSRTYDMGRTRR